MTWVFIPSACSRASACWTKDCEPGSPTWVSRIAPSATLSGKHTEPRSWLRAWKTARWMRHLSGPTFAPSTLERGVAAWIASLPDSPVRTSASPAGAPGLTARAPGSSSKSYASPTIAMRGASFWRTSQASLLPPPPLWTRKKASSMSAPSPASWENWPTAGGMRSGSLFQRPTWVPATDGNAGSASLGGGTWHTPDTMPEAPNGNSNTKSKPAGVGNQARAWMTPSVSNSQGNAYTRDRGAPVAERPTLTGQAQQHWPTPTAALTNDGEDPAQWQARADRLKEKGSNGNGAGMPLTVASAAWPTPRAGDGQKGGPNQVGSKGDLMLTSAAAHWPTPASRDYRSPNAESYEERGGGSKGEQLNNFVAHHFSLHPDQPTPAGPPSSPTTPNSLRRLNPIFGAWLMGWPSTWVIAEPHASSASATALWRSALQQRLSSLRGEPAC